MSKTTQSQLDVPQPARTRTMAERARGFLVNAKTLAFTPATTHAICNTYIDALRSGSRRNAHGDVRDALRKLRAVAAARLARETKREPQ